jgi:uncharacterized protein YaiE (UPF0345 family)
VRIVLGLLAFTRRTTAGPIDMTLNESLACTAVATKANVYFDGKCVSHSLTLADGTKKSVGVILPSILTFTTGAPEIMEGTAGTCEYMLAGTDTWVASGAGEKFSVPGESSFQIRVAGEPYSYICHFG